MVQLLSLVLADIYVSGDARIRPRMDIKNIPPEYKSNDLYYLYRARLNIKADIGKEFFLNLKLGTNDISAISKMADPDENSTNGPGNYNSYRPQVNFLELYYGFYTEKFGIWAGAFPLKYNPALDIHYYPWQMVDIPWARYNNNTITGFAGYNYLLKYKINWILSVDKNNINSEEIGSLATDQKDTYSLGFNTSIDVGPISITPRFLYTLAGESENAPMTLGGDIKLLEIAGFTSSLSYYMSSNSNEGGENYIKKYEANHIRLKLDGKIGPGNLSFFYDIASNTPDGEIQRDYNYLWLSYEYIVHKSEMGSVTLKPTFRMQNGGYDEGGSYVEDYSRNKIEFTTEFKFN